MFLCISKYGRLELRVFASSWQRELAVPQTTQNPYTPYMCVFSWVWCDGHPSLMSHPLIFERVLFHSEKRIGVISSVSVVTSLKKPRGDWELTTVAVILQVLQETVLLPAYTL